jgi:hypothetical protein
MTNTQVRRSSRKFADYNEVLAYRKAKRAFGCKTGHIYKDWQGLYAFMYTPAAR